MPRVSLDAAVTASRAAHGDLLPSLDVLAAALACYGLTGRRTQPNWNEDSRRKLQTQNAVWARPTPSGGGMYPAETYLVTGNDATLPAGVYHYATAHHGLDRLAVGSHVEELAQASGVAAGMYLVASLRFWKNAFKYNSFSYHVVTQDIGALLASWRLVLGAHGIAVEPLLWFDEAAVSDLIGIDGVAEAPFVVVPLGPIAQAKDVTTPGTRATPLEPLIRRDTRRSEPHQVWEKSRRVRSFPLVEEVHAATLVGSLPRPGPADAVAGALHAVTSDDGSTVVTLPAATSQDGDLDLTSSLGARRSSFGALSASRPLDPADLGWMLAMTNRLAGTGTDVAPAPRAHPWIRLRIIANQVDGLEQGGYVYDGHRHRLSDARPVDGAELQRYYALTNYNLREAAVVVVVTGQLKPLVRTYGGRGYRMLSIEVGQSAQALYLAAAARGLGVGAVLGIDNLAVDAMLGIDGTDETSMLFILLGHERGPRAGYDHAIRYPARAHTDSPSKGAVSHD
nr:SagB family peptide dehydrogenase [Phytoactinopolyspora mesophila]